ncbi:tetratricopeptide repeat protein [Pacificibacter marinus]|nr:tetratricopeptide repeat protein [Pacificibacter marinus]
MRVKQFAILKLAALGLSVGLTLSSTTASFADAGSYLATRQAVMERDYQEQAQYASQSLVSDPRNPDLLETLIAAKISVGAFDDAFGYATMLKDIDPSSQTAAMILFPRYVEAGDWDALLTIIEAGEGVSSIVDGLSRAWAHVGKGEMSEALELFDAFSKGDDGFQVFGPYSHALALALVGDFEGGLALLSDPSMPQTGGVVFARAQMLSQLERNDDARQLLRDAFGPTRDPQVLAFDAQLASGESVPFDIVTNAQDGIAEVFSSVTDAVNGGFDDGYTLLYARIALELRPDKADYALRVANILERLQHYDLATQVYSAIDPASPTFYLAELGRAAALRAEGKSDAELEVLRALSKTHSNMPEVYTALGDAMRREEMYGEAIDAYSTALSKVSEFTAAEWPLLFTRGIAYERDGQWAKAEADFRHALELQPGQPQVLNYMGYSFLEMNENLDEAMSMIRAAVAARPDDGYITDSLAWGLFRLRDYEGAVAPMEKATALLPVDPILNDHLGDVYWAVGRTREARFQWNRALSFDPTEKDAERIRLKLSIGLDRVLIEEGLEPTRTPTDG